MLTCNWAEFSSKFQIKLYLHSWVSLHLILDKRIISKCLFWMHLAGCINRDSCDLISKHRGVSHRGVSCTVCTWEAMVTQSQQIPEPFRQPDWQQTLKIMICLCVGWVQNWDFCTLQFSEPLPVLPRMYFVTWRKSVLSFSVTLSVERVFGPHRNLLPHQDWKD